MENFYKKMKMMAAFVAILLATCASAFGQCNPITITSSSPFAEDFSGLNSTTSISTNTVVPNCWNVLFTGTNTGYTPHVYSGSYAPNSSDNGLVFTSGSSTYGENNYAILPSFTNDLANYLLNFTYKMENVSYGTLFVGYMTDITNASSFTVIESLTSFTTRTEAEVVLTSIPAGARLAFRWTNDYIYYSCCIDDITISTPPTCPKPTGVAASNITTTSVDLSWTSSASAWEIMLNDNEIVPASTNPFTITNLQPSSTYSIRVRSLCSATDTSAWSNAITINTACGAINITEGNPFYQDFNSFTATSYSTAGTLPNCWSTIYTGSSAGYSPHVCTSNSYVPEEGSQALSITAYNSSTYGPRTYVILPEISNPLNTLQISFVHSNYSSTVASQLSVGYMTSTTDSSTFVKLADVPHIYYSTNRYNEFEYDIEGENIPAGARLALRASNSSSTTDYIFIDNLRVRLQPTCLKPLNLQVSTIQPNKATISWTARNGETSWEVECNGIITQVTENPYMLTGLTDNAEQHVRVRAVCSSTDQSEWSNMLIFNTPCNEVTITDNDPFMEDFTSYTGTSYLSAGPMPNCWEKLYTGSSSSYAPHVCTSNSYVPAEGSQAFFMHASSSTSYGPRTYAVLPIFSNELNTLQVTFGYSHYSSSAYSHTSLGYMTNPTDSTTFVELVELPHAYYSATRYNEFEYNIEAADIPSGARLAFRHMNTTSNSDYFFVDDIVVRIKPSCLKPTDLTSSNVTPTSAEISWTSHSEETQWEIMLNGQIISADSNPFVLENLYPNSTQHVSVRAICSATDQSLWSSELIFQTPCTELTITEADPYFDNFSTYTPVTAQSHTAPGDVPGCWDVIFTGTSASYTPAVYTGTYAVSGDTCFAIVSGYGASYGYTNYAVMPSFTNPLTDLQLEFGVTMEGAYGTLYVGYITDMDTNNFVSMLSINAPAPASGADYYQIPIALYATDIPEGARLAFKYGGLTSSYRTCALYDVRVRIAPNCLRPTDVYASNILPNSATIGWTTQSGATTWEVECDGNVQQTSSNPFSISGLLANTEHHVRVRSLCSATDTSEWSQEVVFNTPCDAFTITATAPFVENFDSITGTSYTTAGSMPSCWETLYTGSSLGYAPHVSTSNTYCPVSGSQSLMMYAYASASYGPRTYVVFPLFTNDLSTLQVSFAYSHYSSTAYSQLSLGYMTNPADSTSFVELTSVPHAYYSTNRLNEFEFSIGQGIPVGARLAFRVVNNNSYTDYNFIDNVVVALQPSCPTPNTLAVSNVTANSVDLSWNSFNCEGNWEIEIDGDTIAATTNPFTLTDLTSGTRYSARVRSFCSETDTSDWSQPFVFTTLCETRTITFDNPFSEDFTNWTSATYSTDSGIPSCWDRYWTGSAGYAPHVYNGTSYCPTPNDNCIFMSGNSSNTALLILPEFTNALNTLQFLFSTAMESATSGQLTVGYVSNGTAVSNFTALTTIPSNAYSSTPRRVDHVLDLSGYTIPAGARLAFRWAYATSTTSWYCCVDDILLRVIPDCSEVSDITVEQITNNSAQIGWTAADSTQNQWEINCNGSIIPATTNPFTLTGLTSNTDYTVNVRAVCGENDYSYWTLNDIEFTTACDPMTITATDFYTDDFESYTAVTSVSATGETPDCWGFNYSGTSTGYAPHILRSSTYSPNNNVLVMTTATGTTYGNNTYAVLPTFTNPMAELEFDFDAAMSTVSYHNLTFGYMTDVANGSTYVALDTISYQLYSNGYSHYEIYLAQYGTIPANARLAFCYSGTSSSSYYAFVDNIRVRIAPSCIRPQNVTVDNIDMNGATISWQPIGEETQWEVTVGNDVDTIVSSTSVTISGLASTTHYDVVVRAVCSGEDVSEWSDSVNFMTLCDAITITMQQPYLENFESYETTNSISTFTEQPDCWNFIYGGSSSGYAPHVYNGTYSPTGTNSLVMTSGSSTYGSDNFAVLPLFSNALNTLEVSFKVKMESSSYGTLYAGYMTNADDASTFVSLATITSSSSPTTYTYALNEQTFPANARLAFKWSHSTSYYSVAIDDIDIHLGCETPTNVTIDEYHTIRWEGDASSWNLRYVVNGDTTVIVAHNPIYTISNLPDNANVTVQIQAVCDATHSSAWSDAVSFNTTLCLSPTNVNMSASGLLSWTSDADSWNIRYTVNGGEEQTAMASTNSFQIPNLQDGDQVTVQVQSVCGEDATSDWTNQQTFTYTGINEYNAINFKVFPNPTDGVCYVEWTATNETSVLYIYDVYGKMVSSQSLNGGHATIDLSSFADGIYMMRVVSNNVVKANVRVVKQ